LADATYLPERLFALSHHLNQGSMLVAHEYWGRYYEITIAFLLLRVFGLLLAAGIFGIADRG
jgi:hypothetical protein